MPSIGLSSFSLRRQIGPVVMERFDRDGTMIPFTLDATSTLSMREFVTLAPQRLPLDHLEICQVQLVGMSDWQLADLADAVNESGLAVLAMPVDVGDIGHPLRSVRDESLAANIEWFDIAARVGARAVRVNAVSPHHDSGLAATTAELTEALLALSDAAADRGLDLLLENKGGTRDYAQVLVEILSGVDAGRLGLILDIGNFEPYSSAMIGHNRGIPIPADLELERLYSQIELLAPWATVVHVKSHIFDEAGVHSPLDIERALSIVAAHGFDGPLTIEYEGNHPDPWAMSELTLALTRRVMGERAA